MRLFYFKEKNYTLDELRKRRNDLSKVFHPDVNKDKDAKEKMQTILDEYDFVKKNLKEKIKQAPIQEPNKDFLKRAAQNIFHALTNANGVDYNLLSETIQKIPNERLKAVSTTYFNQYGFDLVNHINKLVKDKKVKKIITLTIKASTGDLNAFELYSFFKLF